MSMGVRVGSDLMVRFPSTRPANISIQLENVGEMGSNE